MTLQPVAEDDKRLRQTCSVLSLRELRRKEQQIEIDELLDFVYGKGNKNVPGAQRDGSRPGTVGLSANQVGVMKQICVVDLSIGHRGYYDLHALVNPRIVWRSKTMIEKAEGCVNFPTIWGRTRRSATVRVEALDRSGNEIKLKVTGWAAVLLQHEVDHVNGRLFIDRLIDPVQADLVEAGEFQNYRKQKNAWSAKIDVSERVIKD